MKPEEWAPWVASYGALLASITFGWNIWREFWRDRGRLKVTLTVMNAAPFDDPTNIQMEVLYGTVTNVGRRTMYLTNIALGHKDGRASVWLSADPSPIHFVPQYPHELKEGQRAEARLPIQMLDDTVVSFFAEDSAGGKWTVPRKQLARAKKLAKEPRKSLRK